MVADIKLMTYKNKFIKYAKKDEETPLEAHHLRV